MSDELIQFSDAAILHIKKIMAEKLGQSNIFRLSIKKTGCSGYMYQPEIIDAPRADDRLITIADDFVVYVDMKSLVLMKGTQVDYVQKGLGQQQLIFMNPNAVGECGCGESFLLQEENK